MENTVLINILHTTDIKKTQFNKSWVGGTAELELRVLKQQSTLENLITNELIFKSKKSAFFKPFSYIVVKPFSFISNLRLKRIN